MKEDVGTIVGCCARESCTSRMIIGYDGETPITMELSQGYDEKGWPITRQPTNEEIQVELERYVNSCLKYSLEKS